MPGSATQLAGSWTRFSFSSGMSRSKQLNVTSAASNGSEQPSTTGLASSRPADGSVRRIHLTGCRLSRNY